MSRTNGLRSADGEGVAIYARTAADDAAGAACQNQVREAVEALGEPAHVAVYADAGKPGLDGNRPALGRLLADVRLGHLRCVIVRDIARLARSASLLESIRKELTMAGVGLVTVEEVKRHA